MDNVDIGNDYQHREKIYWLLLLLVCTLIISQPCFGMQFASGDDTIFHMNRIEGIKEGLLAGQFPVRIHGYQLNGYGFASGIFYPDIFLYFPAMLRILGMPMEIVWNFCCVLLNLFTMGTAWYSYTRITGTLRAGALSTIIYLSLWYRLMDFYLRGAAGEMLAIAFLPLVLSGLLDILHGEWKRWPVLTLGFTGLLESHVLSSLLAAGCSLVICGISWRAFLDEARRKAFFKSVVYTLLLNLWYIIPFLYFYAHMDFNMKDSFHTMQGMGFSLKDWVGLGMQFCWGIPAALTLLVFLYEGGGRLFPQRRTCWLWLAFGVSLFFTWGALDTFPWAFFESLPLFGKHLVNIQLPWRLVELAAISLSLCGGVALAQLRFSVMHRYLLAAICLSACVWNIFTIQYFLLTHHEEQYHRVVYEDFREKPLPSYGHRVGEDYLYKGLHFEKMTNREGMVPTAQDIYTSARVKNVQKQGTTMMFSYEENQPELVQLPLFYYPGYKAADEQGREIILQEGSQHMLQLELPMDAQQVQITYTGIWWFRITDILSLLCVFCFMQAGFKKLRGNSWL